MSLITSFLTNSLFISSIMISWFSSLSGTLLGTGENGEWIGDHPCPHKVHRLGGGDPDIGQVWCMWWVWGRRSLQLLGV
jgi:hypothetical protein